MKIFEYKKTIILCAAILWTIIIVIGCTLPGKALPVFSIFDHLDKLVHLVFFFILYILWFNAFESKKNLDTLLLVILCVFGLLIEIYQKYFVLGRSFDRWDVIADWLGVFTSRLFLAKIKFG